MNTRVHRPVHIICGLVVACVVLGCPSRTGSAPLLENFEQIYVFGDSLSDTGNVFQTTEGTIPPSPPYGQGRFSNGPVWVEYLASKLELGPAPLNNFAFGGATTDITKTSDLDGTPNPPGLLGQIQDFRAANSSANPNALYVVWAGANDYLKGATNPAVPLENLSRAVQLLAGVGAQHILVVNLPDLGKLPATLNSPSAATLSHLTRAHNVGLSKTLKTLNQDLEPDTQIKLLDINFLFNQAIANPARFGLTNVTTPCLVNSVVCNNPDEFLFWDSIHPTTAGHQILGKLAFFALTPEAVPEPVVELAVLTLGIGVAGLQTVSLLLKRKRRQQLTS